MRCPRCRFENPEEMKFCGQCASPLSLSCWQCGVANPLHFKFCGGCGTSLPEQGLLPASIPLQGEQRRDAPAVGIIPPGSRPVEPETRKAERRQLTVMFCDLVGSTALAERLDPEEWREVVQLYQAACADVVGRFEGHIAQYLGDGLLVYFGYPVAHEDDAQRAVRAGLHVVEKMRALNAQLRHSLQVRVGIHTGRVVVGRMGESSSREQLALGDTPNIAARVQSLAEPDSVLTSSATYQLTRGFFHYLDLGPQKLKGITTPVPVHRPLRESDIRSRFEATALTGLTPLVGRDTEVGFLLERWERVREGMGQVVLLSGEPGIGKSRLVQVLKARLPADTHTRLEFHCSPYHQQSAFYPVIELLQRLLQFRREDTPEEKLDKLERMLLQECRVSCEEVVPLFASLLSLPSPSRYAPLNLSPQKQKQKTQEALVTWLLAEAERKVAFIGCEDLQWADPSTLEFLRLLIEQIPTIRIYLLLTFRPEFIPPWGTPSHLTHLTLGRLPRQQAEVMVERVAGGKTLPAAVLRQLVTKTDGVPLFVEELTKMVLESGLLREADEHYELTGPLASLAIPATLSDSLMARLDRLGTVKDTAQLGATLGREFPYELIRAVSPLDDSILQGELAKLVEAELLYQRGLPPQAQYIFKHTLIQEAAYQSLLKSKRQQYHQQIAQTLVERFPETAQTQPELLAHHYTGAGFTEQAVSCWQQAGQRAVVRSANAEAINHLTKGLQLLQSLPNTLERARQELMLRVALGMPLIATKGYGAAEVEETYGRAHELCQQVGDTPQLFRALGGLWEFYMARAELHIARELGEQILFLAHRHQDPSRLLSAHVALGEVLFYLGEVFAARAHIEQGIALYDRQQHGGQAFLSEGADPGVNCLAYAAWILWVLGYPDQALRRSQEALTLAQDLSHPFSIAYALNWAAVTYLLRREGQDAKEQVEEALALSTAQGFPVWMAMGTILQGKTRVEQGQKEEGMMQMRQSLASWRTIGIEIGRPYWLAMLAETCEKTRQTQEGLAFLAEALAEVQRTKAHHWEAELYRIKGELTLQPGAQGQKSGAQGEAEEYFYKAIAIARHQQAKSLELRAVMSLSRLLQEQGKQDEARQMLAEIHDWFTEGFDTADLREAKTLLDDLL